MKFGLKKEFLDAVHDRSHVSGLTHNFYRYPARYSPGFARTAIKMFTNPGDLVLDPFMGGGTTLVEAHSLGRKSIGSDINELSVFVSKVKTTPLSNSDLSELTDWFYNITGTLNLHNSSHQQKFWVNNGYLQNLTGKEIWPIRKLLELSIFQLRKLKKKRAKNFARCVLLNTAQWALDSQKRTPSSQEFKNKILHNFVEMTSGIKTLSEMACKIETPSLSISALKPICLHCPSDTLGRYIFKNRTESPKLILTSPPYPGVHVLYHRWQVRGRQETSAPYWISGTLDGNGEVYYTLGNRDQKGLTDYYENLQKSFSSVAEISSPKTTVVQMVAFSEPSWQLPKYLKAMRKSGFREVKYPSMANLKDGRIWRKVPNRKWHANFKGNLRSSKEVVLFHRLI